MNTKSYLHAVILGLSGALVSAGTPALAANSMVFTGAGGSYQAAQTTAFIVPFEKATGITIKQDQPYSLAKVRAMVEAGRTTWDAMEVDPYLAMGENCGKYFEKIDTSGMDLSNVDGRLISPCTIPNMQSAYLLVYNKEKYKDHPPQGWQDFFDTEKFPGKRGIMDYADQGVLEIALIADGVAPKDVYPIDYARAFKKLDQIRKDTIFLTTGAEQQEGLERGSIDMMLAWPGRAYEAAKNGAPLATQWNGAMLYWDAVAIPKGAPNLKEAQQFIGYLVQAEPQARLTEETAYGPINNLSKPNVDPLKHQFLPMGENKEKGFLRNMQWWADNLDEATRKWISWSTTGHM